MSKHGKLIQVPENALKQLQQERMEKIQEYLDELGKHAAITNADLDLVMRAAIEHHGLPLEEERAAFFARAEALAYALSAMKLRRLHEGVKEVMQLQNVRDVPDHILWSARRAGVELLEPIEQEH